MCSSQISAEASWQADYTVHASRNASGHGNGTAECLWSIKTSFEWREMGEIRGASSATLQVSSPREINRPLLWAPFCPTPQSSFASLLTRQAQIDQVLPLPARAAEFAHGRCQQSSQIQERRCHLFKSAGVMPKFLAPWATKIAVNRAVVQTKLARRLLCGFRCARILDNTLT